MYIHELSNWPNFFWDPQKIDELLIRIRHNQGRLLGSMESIGFHLRDETVVHSLTQDAVKSSEIEGERLDVSKVRSSVARQLGIEEDGISDRSVDGVVEMILDATQNYEKPLTKERLFFWHRSLFSAPNRFKKLTIGAWRKSPVYIVSGPMGREKIHFEGPSFDRIEEEMAHFFDWINENNGTDFIVKAAIAHLWFETIHPFDDGNGRIGRAIADFLLAKSEKSGHRYYSLSEQIQIERKSYYSILEQSSKGTLDITLWIEWFLNTLGRAIERALNLFEKVIQKSRIWEKLSKIPLNERQRKILNRLLDGFEGNLTSSKWAKIAKCSQDSAYRDIIDLIEKGVLVKNLGKGRNTSYSVASTWIGE